MAMDEVDELYNETVHAFLDLYRTLRHYSRQMHSAGISGRKVAVLRYLLEGGPRTIGQLRDYLYINDSSTSELMKQLEDDGLVTRTRSDIDNRVVIVSLTPAGQTIVQDTPLGGIPLLRERLRATAPDQLLLIRAALQELSSLMDIPDEA